jgi:hypothetical protein
MKTAALLVLLATSIPLLADDALGTLTVKGKTTLLKEVAAAEQADPESPSDKWLVPTGKGRGTRCSSPLSSAATSRRKSRVRAFSRPSSPVAET